MKRLGLIQWIKKSMRRQSKKSNQGRITTEQKLEKRARVFNQKYFGGQLVWKRISYSHRQNSRMFGNCNVRNKTIRISDRLLKMPKFVRDYVLIHELAHLKVAGHGSQFWQLVNQYPKTERARGFLMAIGFESQKLKHFGGERFRAGGGN